MDDYLPDWLKNLVPNAVGDASRAIEPQVSQYRGANGRLDPNAVTSAVPEEVRPEAEMMLKMGDIRREALRGYEPKPLNFGQQLGGILQEISVPVAYAQGNSGYAQQMMPRTILKDHMARLNEYEDKRNGANLNITDQTMSGIGDAAIGYTTERRKRREAAKDMVAKSIAAASVRGPEAATQAAQMAASYLRSLGLKEDADAVMRMVPASPASTPGASPSAPPTGGPLSPSGAGPSGVPGIVTTPPTALPGAPGGSPAAGAPPSGGIVGQMGQAGPMVSPKRQLAELVAPYNEDAAKSLLKEAEAEEAPALEGAKEEAKKRAESRVKLVVEQPDQQKALATTFDTLDGVEQTIDDLLSPDGQTLSDGAASNVGGLWDTYVPNRPGGDAANSWAKITKIKNNIGVMVLNAMREASKTGGAVGNVTEKEWPVLQSQLASLDPSMSDEEFAKSLIDIKKRVSSMRLNTAQAFDQTYGTDVASRISTRKNGSEPSPGAAPAQPLQAAQISAIKQRYSVADDTTKQAILESLQKRGYDPAILKDATPAPRYPTRSLRGS